VIASGALSAGGNREQADRSTTGGSDGGRRAEATDTAVTPPEWVEHIRTNNFEALYPEGDDGGYIGVGIGSTREEALAAAAVDFAGNVSTEVDARVVESGDAQSEDEFEVRIESEVRSQAIVSGLEPLTWEDPNNAVVYALYRTTVSEYQRRLEDWTETMASISEAERKREIQRLEDERAAAERRREEIELEKLREQVRLADRQMRADRYRAFLYMDVPSRERGIPTPYHPEIGEFSGGFRGGFEEYGVDATLDHRFGKIFRIGVTGEGTQDRDFDEDDDDDDEYEYVGAVTGRLDVRLLDRAGWVTSTTLVAGVYGGGNIDADIDPEWGAGPYLAADVIVPEFGHTRWGAYVGSDLAHLRLGWYPFWKSIENSIGVHAAAQYTWWEYGDVLQPSGDRDYVGVGVSFRPLEGFWVTFETRNVSSIRGSLTVSY
jgi:hypothetical protein